MGLNRRRPFPGLIAAALSVAAISAGPGDSWAEQPDARSAAVPSDDCAKTACRDGGFQIAIRLDKEHFTPIPVTHAPYVLPDGSILIFPGETLIFRFAPDGEAPGMPKFVAEYAPEFPAQRDPSGAASAAPAKDLPKLNGKSPKDELAAFPPGTFIVSYGQFKDSSGMNLAMMHNLPHTVKLDAIMNAVTPGKYVSQHTSTCPLMPNMIGFENWMQPLGPMVLQNFRYLPDGGTSMRCD